MSFHPQTTNHTCGPMALVYALTAFGCLTNEKEAARLSNARPADGTDPPDLIRAARALGCGARGVTIRKFTFALQFLKRALQKGRSAILDVDQGNHWVTAVPTAAPGFTVFDPDILAWRVKSYNESELGRRWTCWCKWIDGNAASAERPHYFMILLRPPRSALFQGLLGLDAAGLKRLRRNLPLQWKWDRYLMEILAGKSGRGVSTERSPTEFVRRAYGRGREPIA